MRLFCRHKFEKIYEAHVWGEMPQTKKYDFGFIKAVTRNIPEDILLIFMCEKCGKVIRVSTKKGVLK